MQQFKTKISFNDNGFSNPRSTKQIFFYILRPKKCKSVNVSTHLLFWTNVHNHRRIQKSGLTFLYKDNVRPEVSCSPRFLVLALESYIYKAPYFYVALIDFNQDNSCNSSYYSTCNIRFTLRASKKLKKIEGKINGGIQNQGNCISLDWRWLLFYNVGVDSYSNSNF